VSNTQIGPKDFFEMASSYVIIIFITMSIYRMCNDDHGLIMGDPALSGPTYPAFGNAPHLGGYI
jgi:hypothetical protein